MRSRFIALVSTVLLLTGDTMSAQMKQNTDDHLIARLSYRNTLMEYSDGQLRQVCFAVYDSGLYRLWRPNRVHLNPGDLDPARVLFEGTLTAEQMLRFRTMMQQLDSESRGGGLVQQGSETFLAELTHKGKMTRLKWVDPDHHHPFPQAISRMVDWLQDFQPRNSTRLALRELSDMPVCPSANDNPMPLTAGVSPAIK